MKDFLHVLREANLARNEFLDPGGVLDDLFFATELAGEVGEACNKVKKLARERLVASGKLRGNFSTSTVEELAEELADTIISCDLLAALYRIDLRSATARKWNATSEKVGVPHRITLHGFISDPSATP